MRRLPAKESAARLFAGGRRCEVRRRDEAVNAAALPGYGYRGIRIDSGG